MDCCRTARRLGGEEVTVVVRSPFQDMKASPWEIEDARREDIPILNNMPPKSFEVENGKLKGVWFEHVYAEYDENGRRTLRSEERRVGKEGKAWWATYDCNEKT